METNEEWVYGIEQCWKEEIDILSKDIDETINFLQNECTADEFSWLSEVFDDVSEKVQNREFVDCLYRVAEKYPDECDKYHIYNVLRYTKDALNE